MTRKNGRIVYEWRIEPGVALDPELSIGFDVSVADRDEDGSFSWIAWGSGTQKVESPERCGVFFLVTHKTRFGEVTGKVAWDPPSSTALPGRVRVQSTHSSRLWPRRPSTRRARTRSRACRRATTRSTPLTRPNSGSTRRRAAVRVEPDRTAAAGLLRVAAIPWPGLIGDAGVLRSTRPVDTGAIDRVVKAYLRDFKSQGASVAVVKDGRIVYHNGYGVKSEATQEPVDGDTVFEAASMTKPVFAYTVLRLVDRGVLDLDTPLYTYLPYEDIAYDDRYKLITARMVLTHRTGFPNWRTGKLDIKFTPGTQVSYSGEGFVYLGKVVENNTILFAPSESTKP